LDDFTGCRGGDGCSHVYGRRCWDQGDGMRNIGADSWILRHIFGADACKVAQGGLDLLR
jgi:hypothetical protein